MSARSLEEHYTLLHPPPTAGGPFGRALTRDGRREPCP